MSQPNSDRRADPRKVKVIVELIDHVAKIAGAYERGDLVARMARAKDRITDPQIRVVIAGQLKQGKSHLLNALLNVPVARVGDDESTVLPTVVTYAEQPVARLVVAGPDGEDPDLVEIPTSDVKNDVRFHPLAKGRKVIRLEIGAASPLLKGGLAFVDTPGVGGHGQPHLSATLGLLPDADAMLMVSDVSQEFTEPEMAFIRQAVEICPVARIVATKTDLYQYWRDIVATNEGHLARAGIEVPVIPVSSVLRSHAIATNDKELNEESNFPAVVRFLSDTVLSRESGLIRDQVVAEIRSAAEHLNLAIGSELEALTDPAALERLKADLEARKVEAQDALQQTALWQQVLNDGIADLTADVEHDLRARFRAITQHIERTIDSCDPTRVWAEIGADLEDAIATAVGDNFVWAYHRAEALAEEVARTFVEAGLNTIEMPVISAKIMGAQFDEFKSLQALEAKPVGKGRKATIGLQGSYGGVLMFGMMTSLAGLGMFNPLSIGAGALMGRAAYRENMENRMVRVRSEAKMNTRKFVDDVAFVVVKESRDRLKAIQRQLRDHYRGIANQTTRSLNESLQATIASAKVAENERNSRIKELERQRNVLTQVLDHADKLTA
ncbi:dynamin family protein [Mycolicibacterium sp.]|uniref:dynamin family protein n=1 Tax=Mycolicibacterium sp. TaxID=2320850 RepID=UPI003D12922B